LLLALLACQTTRTGSLPQPAVAVFEPRDAIRDLTPADLGRTFSTTDEAAIAACEWLWANEPKATEWEYCGVIYRDGAGIKAGLPVTKQRPGKCTIPLEPPGTSLEGSYHNHRLTEVFSEMDLNTAIRLAQYLCTPKKQVLKHQPGREVERLK
jgi:hypothetical protein